MFSKIIRDSIHLFALFNKSPGGDMRKKYS